MNYGELKAFTAFMLHRTDLDPFMDTFTEMAREKISKGAKLLVMETNLEIDLSVSSLADLPLDFIAFKSVRLNDGTPLPVYSKIQLDRLTATRRGASIGAPVAPGVGFTINGGQIEVAPPPNTVIQTTYYARPAVLVADEDTNEVLTNWPSIYIQALIATAGQATQDTETQKIAEDLFDLAIGEANTSDKLAAMSGDAPQIQEG